jgi:hypothetical protein
VAARSKPVGRNDQPLVPRKPVRQKNEQALPAREPMQHRLMKQPARRCKQWAICISCRAPSLGYAFETRFIELDESRESIFMVVKVGFTSGAIDPVANVTVCDGATNKRCSAVRRRKR